MKYLGIDFGTKKVGLALSDDAGVLAFAHSVVPNDAMLLETIITLIKEKEVQAIVIGESVDFNGEENVVMEHIREFVGDITLRIPIPVYLEKEFLTTAQARNLPQEGASRGTIAYKGKQKTTQADAQAAAIILQSYLDKQKNKA